MGGVTENAWLVEVRGRVIAAVFAGLAVICGTLMGHTVWIAGTSARLQHVEAAVKDSVSREVFETRIVSLERQLGEANRKLDRLLEARR